MGPQAQVRELGLSYLYHLPGVVRDSASSTAGAGVKEAEFSSVNSFLSGLCKIGSHKRGICIIPVCISAQNHLL